MQRPRALVRRTRALTLGLFAPLSLSLSLLGCAAEIEKLPKTRSERGTLGEEIYKILCRRVAGTELPSDVDGRKTQALCLGDQAGVEAALAEQRAELPPRLVALAERRAALAGAMDEVLPGDLGDGLELLMRDMIPFYAPPEERLQVGTRSMAAVLRRLVEDDQALAGMERFGRDGMTSSDGEFGLLRAVLGHDDLVHLLRTVLPALTRAGEPAAPAFKAALEGLAMEVATAKLEDEPDSDTCRLRELLQRTEASTQGDEKRFASGAKLFAVTRDARGMPVPRRAGGESGADLLSACGDGSAAAVPVPFPFVDQDADGFADIDGGQFVVDPKFSGTLPQPFAVPYEGAVARDQHGRAVGIDPDTHQPDTHTQLYATSDVDPTLLAALMRESAGLFAGDPSVLTSLAGALPAILGERRATSRSYDQAKLVYQATDPDQSPLLDLVHGSGVLIPDPDYDESIELSLQLLREYEPELVASLDPVLALERRTRPDADAYPEAKLEAPNTLWDELLWEAEKLSRWRTSKDGETMLGALLRSTLGVGRNFDKPGAPMEQLIDPQHLAHQGSLMAMLMRYKDEWRGNPTAKSQRQAGDPEVIGYLNTPVDRDKPYTPVTCGKDGCGGPIEGTPFERWRQPNQNCMVQRAKRPKTSKNCGEPANQSLFHRSMGMLAEMEGRAQCNKAISVRDLFQFAADGQPESESDLASSISQAEDALAKDYTCPSDPGDRPNAACRAFAGKYPSAFQDADGSGPGRPSIQECWLLEVKDAGRTFGKVMTHEYTLEIPNPWVRRYLEDMARAAADLPECLAGDVTDPSRIPVTHKNGSPQECVPAAARLSRGMFQELGPCEASDPKCIDTLGELIEFLMDDDTLFVTDADTAALKPDPHALSTVLLSSGGDSENGGFVLFYPLLVRNAPPLCASQPTGAPVCPDDDTADEPKGCCIADPMHPPLRYQLDTYYGATTLAWDHTFKLADGTELSFLDAMRPLADAFDRLDMPAGADTRAYEDTRYGLTTLGAIVAAHYDTPDSGFQNTDPDKAGYRHLTGLVRYERLMADVMDDGSMDMKQAGPSGDPLFAPDARFGPDQRLDLMGKSLPLFLALDQLQFHGRSALAATASSLETWLSPHAFCAGPGGDRRVLYGKGACDEGGARAPVTYRDGRDYVCWNDGTCFDGKDGRDKRFVSPLYLVLDAASAVKRRSDADPALHRAARGVLSGLLDTFAGIENGHLKSRRLRAVALTLGDYVRERYAEEKAAGRLSDWNERTTNDVIDALQNPAVAGGLLALEKLVQTPEALPAISRFLHSLLDENEKPAQARALLAFAADTVQSLPGDKSALAFARASATGFAQNVSEVLAGKQSKLDVENGATWNSAFVLGEQANFDDDNVFGRIFENLTRIPGEAPDATRPLPLSALYDILIDINDTDPLTDGPHTAADLRAAFKLIADVMLDERTGFERMYRMVQCSTKQVHCE